MSHWFDVLLIPAVFAIAYGISFRWYSYQVDLLNELADRLGLAYTENPEAELPDSLTRLLPRFLRTRFGLHGIRFGEKVLSFQLRRGFGKNKRWLTVIAVQQRHPAPLNFDLPPGYRAASQDGWTMLYPARYWSFKIPIRRIPEWWNKLRTSTTEDARAATNAVSEEGGLVIRPRHEIP